MFTLYKKELAYYLNNSIGYIVIVLFAIFANFLYVKDIFVVGSASMRPFFNILPWLLMVFVPALCMRSIAEEKRTNTIELLLTLPVSETQVVLAKYLALLTLTGVSFVLTMGLPVSLFFLTKSNLSNLYIPEILVGYVGSVLIASAFISLSLFFSSKTKNQVVAFLSSAVILFFLIIFSSDFASSVLPKALQDRLNYLSPVYHLQNFIKGLVDLRSLFYFLSFTVAFLFMTIIELEKRE